MNCDAEMCENWTGQGCICAVLDLPRSASTCSACGHVMDDHNAPDRGGDCLACGIDCEGYR